MAAQVRPQVDFIRGLFGERGVATDAAIAAALGIDTTTWWRVANGKAAPGSRFIAAVLTAFPRWRFDDLFEVVNDPESDEMTPPTAAAS